MSKNRFSENRHSVIAISGRKGGIGKSTISANLAAEFLNLGHSVLVLDTDPQQSLRHWADLGAGILADLVRPVETSHPAAFRKVIREAEADRVIVDTPPGFADPALLAALVADLVLLPCGPSPLDINAAREALELAQEAKRERGDGRPRIALVPSKVTPTRLGRELPEALAELGTVLPAIHQRSVCASSSLDGLTVREAARTSKAAQEFAALAEAVDRLLEGGP